MNNTPSLTSNNFESKNNGNSDTNGANNQNLNNTRWKNYLGTPNDDESKIMLRLPDGTKDLVSMPCSSKLMALILYVEAKGYANESYELITNYPRRKLSYQDFDMTLKDAGLFPKETVFVQAR